MKRIIQSIMRRIIGEISGDSYKKQQDWKEKYGLHFPKSVDNLFRQERLPSCSFPHFNHTSGFFITKPTSKIINTQQSEFGKMATFYQKAFSANKANQILQTRIGFSDISSPN